MKTLFATLLIIAIGFSSCTSTSKSVTNFLTSHNFQEQHVIDPLTGQTKIHASIDSLYDYTKVAELCDTADITFHVSRGNITVDADCTGAGETLSGIFKKILSKVNFWK